MKIKKFNEISKEQLDKIIEVHYNHWKKFNPKMIKENTIYKFTKLYTTNELPLGIVLLDEEDNVIGFSVLKIENLKKHTDIFPWLSDVMVLEEYRGKGYGKALIEKAIEVLKEFGYDTTYVWTDQAPDFYKKLGFVYKGQVEKNEGGFGELYCKKI